MEGSPANPPPLSIALIRQSFLDATWYQAAQEAYRKTPGTTERPETNASLAALSEQMQRNPAVDGRAQCNWWWNDSP